MSLESLLDYVFVAGTVTHLEQQTGLGRVAMFKTALAPLLVAYAAYFVLFVLLMMFQSYTRRVVKRLVLKKRSAAGKPRMSGASSMAFLRREPEVVQHPAVVRADRGFQNLVEQFPFFFVSTLAYSLVVSSRWGAIWASLYVCVRALYVPLYHKSALLVSLCTTPSYIILAWMLGRSVASAFA